MFGPAYLCIYMFFAIVPMWYNVDDPRFVNCIALILLIKYITIEDQVIIKSMGWIGLHERERG